jgi:hypothetical protein
MGEPVSAEPRMGTPPPPGDTDQFIESGNADWYVSKSWNRLHAVPDDAWTDEHRADIAAEQAVLRPVRLACGRTASSLHIPGWFTRMAAPRCKGCCRALGYEPGTGSPKNDDRIRPLPGVDAANQPAN